MTNDFNNGLGDVLPIKRFHCVYYENGENFYSKGEDVEARDMISALLKFKEKHNFEPFIIHDKNLTRHGS
jgi:hypothetical protein